MQISKKLLTNPATPCDKVGEETVAFTILLRSILSTNNYSCWSPFYKKISRNLIASMFFDGFPSKTNHLLRSTMPNCSEKNIAISPKLATLASGQILLMIHRQTDRHTRTQASTHARTHARNTHARTHAHTHAHTHTHTHTHTNTHTHTQRRYGRRVTIDGIIM